MKSQLFLFGLSLLLLSCASTTKTPVGQSSITKWKDNKKAAISITYDDGIITQFTVARPIMNRLGLPATFYVITGKIEGAAKGKFIGRPKATIIAETATIKTNAENFFERASLIAFTGTSEAILYHSNAGSLFERGKIQEAYALIDEGYEKLRKGQLRNTEEVVFHDNKEDTTTWNDLKLYAAEGHEIASHTVTHPRLAVLDEANLLYEIEQSKTDVQQFMGEKYTFSAECPYGTEDERVMEYAHKVYPSLRNRMPEPYLHELNRASKEVPSKSTKEYVQWQRGPLSKHSMELMKSWVDTCLANDNIWLVLVFHGVNEFGWEPKTAEELTTYFSYIKEKESAIWVATFADVTKYVRSRKNATITSTVQGKKIIVHASTTLDSEVYDVPLTVKTYIREQWQTVTLRRGKTRGDTALKIYKDTIGKYVLFNVLANGTDELVIIRSK